MIGFDTETYRFERGRMCPRLVCLSVSDGAERMLFDRAEAVGVVEELLSKAIIGHNAPYDLAVLCEAHRTATGTPDAVRWVFEALDAGRIRDTMVRETLLRIATGTLDFSIGERKDGSIGTVKSEYDLAGLVKRYLREDISETKSDPDAWRLRYAELDGVPVDQWPLAARDYAIMDAVYPPLIAAEQIAQNPREVDGYEVHDGVIGVHTEAREVAASFCLHLMAVWGFRTDPERVADTIEVWKAGSEAGVRLGERLGFIRVKGRDKGKPGSVDKKKLQALVSDAYADNPPKTDPTPSFPEGQVRTSEEVLEYSGNADLKEYAKSLNFSHLLSHFGDTLIAGTTAPITSRPNVLVATGRTSWAKPPMQQPPREGGFRDCFVPRPGFLFASADYDFIELCSLAQICRWVCGFSTLGDDINAGLDPHMVMAIAILRAYNHPETPATYEEGVRRKKAKDPLFTGGGVTDHRQLAKSANFGFPGGLGPDTFVEYAHSNYGIDVPYDQAVELRAIWHRTRPEMKQYFAWVTRQIDPFGTIQQFVSGRVRGGVTFTSGANTFFQGLTADGAKYAMYLVSRACYSDPSSALYGSRPVLMLHDEIIAEVPESQAAEAAEEMARLMRFGMSEHIPDIRIGCKPALTRRWTKGADPTYVGGKLVVTE